MIMGILKNQEMKVIFKNKFFGINIFLWNQVDIQNYLPVTSWIMTIFRRIQNIIVIFGYILTAVRDMIWLLLWGTQITITLTSLLQFGQLKRKKGVICFKESKKGQDRSYKTTHYLKLPILRIHFFSKKPQNLNFSTCK